MHARRRRAAQAGAEVVRVLNAVQHEQQRLLHAGNGIRPVRRLPARLACRRHALMTHAGQHHFNFIQRDGLDRHAARLRLSHQRSEVFRFFVIGDIQAQDMTVCQ